MKSKILSLVLIGLCAFLISTINFNSKEVINEYDDNEDTEVIDIVEKNESSSSSTTTTNLIDLVIPEGTTEIKATEFSFREDIKSVTIPSSVTNIGEFAFSNCLNLKNIDVSPENQNYSSIDGNLYDKEGKVLIQYAIGKTNSSFTIPQGTTNIGSRAFSECVNLNTITIPSSIRVIKNFAISVCQNLKNINVSEDNPKYRSIDGNLYNKEGTVLEQYAIGKTDSSFTIPAEVQNISIGAFESCNNLINVVVTDNVRAIQSSAFSSCKNLKNITLPKKMKLIDSHAFSGCESLTNFILPKGIATVSNDLFVGCKNLATIVIPEGVTSIGAGAFCNCKNLTNITIPNSVTNIDHDAFTGCINLTNIVIPEGVTNIGDSAFRECSSLTKIVIPGSIKNLGKDLVKSCRKLKTIIIKKGVEICRSDIFPIIDANIFVEAKKEEVDWDEKYPNWNHYNSVYYGGEWLKVEFYGINNELICADAYFSKETIIIPDMTQKIESCYTFLGWDINNDGEADEVPNTPTSNIVAKALYSKVLTNVTYHKKIDATCTTKGSVEHWTCEICHRNYTDMECTNEIDDIDIEVLEHVCTTVASNDGKKHLYVCEVCHTIVDEAEHTYTDVIESVEPTCNSNGYEKRYCNKCGYEKIENLPKIDHKYKDIWLKDDDKHYHECEICHDKVAEGNHEWDSGVVTKEATIDEEGVLTYTCKICGDIREEIIPKLEKPINNSCKNATISIYYILGVFGVVFIIRKKKLL